MTAERGSVSRSTFNRSKTHGISCARSALRAAAGRRPALRSIWATRPLAKVDRRRSHPRSRTGARVDFFHCKFCRKRTQRGGAAIPAAQTSPPSPLAPARSRRSEAETDKSVYPESFRGWSRPALRDKPADVTPHPTPCRLGRRRAGAALWRDAKAESRRYSRLVPQGGMRCQGRRSLP